MFQPLLPLISPRWFFTFLFVTRFHRVLFPFLICENLLEGSRCAKILPAGVISRLTTGVYRSVAEVGIGWAVVFAGFVFIPCEV